jgi:polyketide biosynthesis acyl carrier protein
MTHEEVFNILTRHTLEVIPTLETHQFKIDDSLRALGANSVDRSEIVMLCLQTLRLNMPLMDVARAENMGELAGIIHAKL